MEIATNQKIKMINFLLNLLLSGLAVFFSSYILPGVHLTGFGAALLVAFVLGIVNAIVRPILFALTLPINILTLGIFTFIINALMILLADSFIDSFKVDSFLWALLFSLVLSVISTIIHAVVPSTDLTRD